MGIKLGVVFVSVLLSGCAEKVTSDGCLIFWPIDDAESLQIEEHNEVFRCLCTDDTEDC